MSFKLIEEQKVLDQRIRKLCYRVSREPLKTFEEKLENGFFEKYMSGHGVDIGYRGGNADNLPILPSAIGVDIGFRGYDGVTLPFPSGQFDYVYSSHCLEHVLKPFECLREWHRVLKDGGYLIVVVPHQYLYEKKAIMPSRFSREHLRFFTPSKLLEYVEAALEPNSYRVKSLEDGDQGFDYDIGPEEHSIGQYEITLVIKKINAPNWKVE